MRVRISTAVLVGLVIAATGCPPPDVPPPITPTPPTVPPDLVERPDCSNYTYRNEAGAVIAENLNCVELDRCDTTASFTAVAGCCACDFLYCNPDPTCEPAVPPPPVERATGCMQCHNGSQNEDYAGPGMSNPHPFGVPGGNVSCISCHGGDGTAQGKDEAHVPPPPQIGDRQFMQQNPEAWFNFLNRAGMDRFPDYTANGRTYTAKEYLQFINPGDTRIVSDGNGCGSCHAQHGLTVGIGSPINTEIGFFSSATYHIGVDNAIPQHRGLYGDTASDYTYRGGTNPDFTPGNAAEGEIGLTVPVPEYAQFGGEMYNNPGLAAANLNADQYNSNNFATDPPEKNGQVRTGSNLAKLFQTQISITCGDCHAGSSGANNRYADFRSSGCTACHMEYSMDGRSRSTDTNVKKFEPANADAIAAPERPHIDAHQIRNVAKILPNGAFLRGISDRACVGCHQGSNRTVLQYWGIRLDQNADLANNFQYPANPVTFTNTAADTRLFDPAVQNNTFNGRNANQYILYEDYDGDLRDDTPPDIHYELGLGCIDCHGSRDVHSGTADDPDNGKIFSKMDQVVKVRCENCHGHLESYAATRACQDYSGATTECVMDEAGNPLKNTFRDVNGDFFLNSRVDGQRHYIPQVADTVQNNNKRNPLNGQLVFNPLASYSMGRFDGVLSNGVGPQQTNPALVQNGFSHTDNMDCMSCHASWANQCVGCHLRTQYDAQNFFFSNITGERIIQKQQNADFSYISPVMTYLSVNSKNKITQTSSGMKVFFAYIDLNGQTSDVFAFSDRNGNGNNPNTLGRNAHPALGQYQMAAHSVRGKVTAQNEGPKYCVACHNTVDGLNNFGADYAAFLATYAARDYANLNFALLQQHIGQNTGNQLNSPFFVHSTAGLGTGLFLFDANGCPVNPLDANANRFFCNGNAPADNFDANNVAYDTDRMVEFTGVTNVSSLHPMIEFPTGLRDGSLNPNMAGTLGATIINKLTNTNTAAGGKVLDSWLDANAAAGGDAANYIQ
jgi:hypothetical protein